MLIIKTLLNRDLWTGRIDSDPTSLRYHQVVEFSEVNTLSTIDNQKIFSIIGFESDEGVKRNQGRIGAAEAPNEIRKFLSNLPFHHSEDKVVDVGNVPCTNGKLELAQEKLGTNISKLLNKNCIPIIIGGGHETLYGHYLGVREFIGPEASLGIINIDAHFDLRDDEVPSSGTMFRQILSKDQEIDYLCLGIQELGNTKSLFDAAKEYNCRYILEENIRKFEQTFLTIDDFANEHDYIILTLCTDAISSSSAPGVSAPSPFGLEPTTVRTLLRHIAAKGNLLSFDISEVNPLLDENNKTSRLAALLLADVMKSFGN